MKKITKFEKEQLALLELLKEKEEAIRYNKISLFYPDEGEFPRSAYPKHVAFMNSTEFATTICFMAGNRTGKTLTGACLMSWHLTGDYPTWYTGRRFTAPVEAWAASVTNESTRDIQQKELLGSLMDIGTGFIPKDKIIKVVRKSGIPDAIATVYVRHSSGGISQCTYKSYDQGPDSFQGTKKQVIWLDEEPQNKKIYTECITRTASAAGKNIPGIIMCTFTPLFGMSDVARNFLSEDNTFPTIEEQYEKRGEKFVCNVGWEEIPHLSEREKTRLAAEYPEHERDARTKGIPALGSGAIYPFSEDKTTCTPFKIPSWWKKAYGLDVGWNITAAVWGALDPDSGTIYIYSEHYEGQASPSTHARAIKDRGDWIAGSIDPASTGSSQIDGRRLADLYQDEGLLLELADNSTETGILKVRQAFESGQLKIFTSCRRLIGELRNYCRDEKGKIIKREDHALDALRYLIMACPSILQLAPDDEKYGYSDDAAARDDITGY